MKAWRTKSFIACAFVALLAAPVGAAEAMAPTYVSSEPEDGAMLERAPERVEVTFDEPLDEASDLSVKDECGRTIDAGDARVEANTISVGLALKPVGVYEVTYFAKGVGGLTGQETGTFDFMVHKGPTCGENARGHGGHGDDEGNEHGGGHEGTGGGGNHGGSGNHGGGGNHAGGGNHGGGSSGGREHSGSSGHTPSHGSGGGTNYGSADHSSRHDGSGGAGRHNPGKHGSKQHGGGGHGGKHGGEHGIAGAHGLLDILEKNERKEERALAAAGDGIPVAPDGQAVLLALALSLVMGVLGGWFLRVSGGR